MRKIGGEDGGIGSRHELARQGGTRQRLMSEILLGLHMSSFLEGVLTAFEN
jgi:hypothetical protein